MLTGRQQRFAAGGPLANRTQNKVALRIEEQLLVGRFRAGKVDCLAVTFGIADVWPSHIRTPGLVATPHPHRGLALSLQAKQHRESPNRLSTDHGMQK
jgi:hypothetical protein